MTSITSRTWTISDTDGSNRRKVTLEQYRAEMAARVKASKPISDAWRRGDLAGVEAAQKAFRKQYA